MKLIVTTMMCMLLLAPMAAMPSVSADSSITATVLIDFGNGKIAWADVDIQPGMNALNLTTKAAEQLGLSIDATGGFVSMIGNYSGNWPNEIWNFFVWNSTTTVWDMPWTGAGDVPAEGLTAIAWEYAAYRDTTLYVPPYAPLATPDHKYPWASFRHDNLNTGSQLAFAPNNLTLKWAVDLENGAIDTPVIVANGFEYVITGGKMNWTTYEYDTNSSIFCLNGTGGTVWHADIGTGYQVGAPLVYAGMVIVPSANGKVFAFNAKNGSELWSFDTYSAGSYGVTSSPIAYLGKIIVATGNGKVFSLNENGTQAWNRTVASVIYSSSPAVANQVIYIGADDGKLHAIAANGSSELWSAPIGSKVRGSPILMDDMIVVTYVNNSPAGGGLAAIGYDGTMKWQTATSASPASAALTSEGFVSVIPTGATMTAFNGTLLWNVSLGTGFSGAAPSSVNGSVYMVTNEANSRLIALNNLGEIYWQQILSPVQYALSAPTISDGVLYISSDNGYVYAFDLNNVAPPTPSNDSTVLIAVGIVAVALVLVAAVMLMRRKK
jgi:outer membrane protein assembly factor BamB